MSNEIYQDQPFIQNARFDVYKQAKVFIPRAIKEMIRVWGVNVEIYQQSKMGIGGHTDNSRAEFSDIPLYKGSAFVPSVVQSQVGRGRTAMLDIFERKTPRIFFDVNIELPYGALVVVRDMDRVMNYILKEKKTAISPNSQSVYSSYDLVPYNIIDKNINKDELENVKEAKRDTIDIDEFIVEDDYDNTDNTLPRKQTFTDTNKKTFNNVAVHNTGGLND